MAIVIVREWKAALIDCRLDGGHELTGSRDALNAWTLAGGWPTHPIADLRGVHIEFGEGAAEGIAMHTEFFGGLALVALVLGKHFKDVTLLELSNGLRVGNAGAVHLRDETVKFALQGYASLGGSLMEPLSYFASTSPA